MILLLLLGVFAANMLVGTAVLCAIDDKEQSLFRWFSGCPSSIAWFAQPLTLTAWPILVWLRFKK